MEHRDSLVVQDMPGTRDVLPPRVFTGVNFPGRWEHQVSRSAIYGAATHPSGGIA